MSSRLLGARMSYHLLPNAYPSTPPPTRRIGPRRWLRSRGRAARRDRAAVVCGTAFAAADEGVLRDDVVGTDLDLPSPAQPARHDHLCSRAHRRPAAEVRFGPVHARRRTGLGAGTGDAGYGSPF